MPKGPKGEETPWRPDVTNSKTNKRLLVCDIDNTLTGSFGGIDDLRSWLAENPDTAFAIATGRALPGTIQVLKDWNIPVPGILITAVGTEIYYSDGEALAILKRDTEWEKSWSTGWQPSTIMRTLAAFAKLGLQAATEQRQGKLSYILNDENMIGEIKRALKDRGLATEIIYSHGEFLDILPENASKGHAVRYVAKKFGIPMDKVIAAGDSGNDFCMLTMAGQPIVVGNHSSELNPQTLPDETYFAERSHAEGIVEGLEQVDEDVPNG